MTDGVKRWLDADVLATLIALHRARADGDAPGTIFVPKPLLGRVSITEIDSILREAERLRRRDVRRSTAPDLLALRMASNGRGRLYEHVRSGETFDLGDNYRVVRFFDFGAESLLFLGEARLSGQPLVVKLPFVDYTDLTDLDVEQLLRRRKRLGREAEMLRALGGTALPSFIAEWSGLNPLFPAGLPSFLRSSEQFLLMELIRGRRVDDLGRWLHRMGRSCCCARLAAAFGAAFLALASDIEHRIGPAGAYTDIKPENALVQGTSVRIVDASSIVRDAHAAGPLPVSEAYLDPVDLERWRGGALVPDVAYALRSLARCMRMLVSNAPLLVGRPAPDWPNGAGEHLGAAVDTLVSQSEVTWARAADELRRVLDKLSCAHGSGPIAAEAHEECIDP